MSLQLHNELAASRNANCGRCCNGLRVAAGLPSAERPVRESPTALRPSEGNGGSHGWLLIRLNEKDGGSVGSQHLGTGPHTEREIGWQRLSNSSSKVTRRF
jgi:hypothetical protein